MALDARAGSIREGEAGGNSGLLRFGSRFGFDEEFPRGDERPRLALALQILAVRQPPKPAEPVECGPPPLLRSSRT
jgi:hypothetical protein